MTSESNLLFWRLDVANFMLFAGPVNTAATQILKIKLHNYGHNIPRRFTQAHKSNNKAYTLMVYLPRFLLFPRSVWFEWLRCLL